KLLIGDVFREKSAMLFKRNIDNSNFSLCFDGIDYTAVEMISYILRKLADDVAMRLGFPVRDVVITCPAYYILV
ncbi:MAG TPA: Hsp70 family protein, partial [Ktedonobacteraceae bacterium]|nr:Hsp70 family protein [Ktedonobacteraceae bacterium]